MVKESVGARSLMVIAALAASAFREAGAQAVGAQSVNAKARPSRVAPGVLLVVRPRVGDTLWLQMEQTIEMSSRPSAPPGFAEYGPRRTRSTTRITRLWLYAHSLVEAGDLAATTLLATTDSMAMGAGTASDARQPQLMTLPLEGRQVRVRVTPDGAMRVNDPPPGAMELGATLAAMPGMLPSERIRVGDEWERDIVLPSLPVSGYRADGSVRARFRFDSLSRRGRDAWISMEGSLQRDGTYRDLPAGTRVITAGVMRGTLVVDLQRAWIIDARTVIDVQSEASSGPGSGALSDLRIQQRVRVR